MLRSFRSAAHSWIAKLLFVLLIGSFAVWGVGDMVRGIGKADDPVTVGGTHIPRTAVDAEFRRMVERLRPMMGGNFTNEQAVQLGFADQAAQVLAQRALLRMAAESAGVSISDAQVRAQIAQDKMFQNRAGQFDPAAFVETLRRNNLSELGYVAMVRDDMARELLTAPVASGAYAPKALTDALFAHRGERRVAEIVTLPHAAIADVGVADEAALKNYHAEHPIAFTAPEYRSLTVLQLLLDDLAKEVKISDADVAQAYEERRAEFETPERRKLRIVVLDDEAKAAALATAAQTQGIDAAAKAAGTDVVDLGELTKNDLPGFGDAVFGLPAGVSAQPVRSPLGWHVVETSGITPGAAKPLAQVRDKLAKDLARERAADGVFQTSNRLDDQLAGGASLEDVAKGLGLKIVKAAAVDATGKAPDGSDVGATLTDGARIVETAFTLAPNAASALTEARSGDFFVVRVDNVVAPALRPFETVREQVAAAWKTEQQAAKAAAKAKELAEKLKAAPTDGAAALAAAYGAQLAVSTPFPRDQAGAAGLPPDVVARLFKQNVGDVATGETGDAQIVARLKEIVAADPAKQAGEADALRASTGQAMERDLLGQFVGALQEKWPIVIHHDRLNQMYRQN